MFRDRVSFLVACGGAQVNVDVPARLARAAKAAGVKNFVHVSALAQDPESPSMWAKTKVRGMPLEAAG